MSNTDLQRELTSLLLRHLASYSFALAGSGAAREHGLISRPTQDIDVFARSTISQDSYDEALESLPRFMTRYGWHTEIERRGPTYSRCIFTRDQDTLEVDLGIDWRAHEPTMTPLGPVLSLEDAISAKLSALYSRAYPRDFLDAYNIRKNSTYTDEELLMLLKERDPGFDREMFAIQLESIQRFHSWPLETYEVSAEEFEDVKASTLAWAQDIRASL
ncbi:nucleotidyl transferase AbiEii/AbiGii toxin family protein [Schaalia sp. ZJ1691]|uniref:nucleotidyl transferase AbiEii/AbiGii toxin family protein n=1 Tax=Schaalia sp. ZJ1691 TaxID=2709404 RepID=UPI0013EB6B47|nr:nucleotidyl transferase AbiEii/AbiGii toxin family protein [Schaalia sp. ZJ1691]